MPEPSQRPPQPGANVPPPAPQAAAQGKRNSLILYAVICVLLLTVGVGATLFALHKNSTATTPAPSPTPTAAAHTPAPTPTPVAAAPPAPVEASTPKPAPRPTVSLDQCRAIWTCNQDSGTNVNDTTGNGNIATLIGNDAVWTNSARAGSAALSLGGASYAETPSPVIDTANSFTVAAWVNLAAIDRRYNQTMVSIDGDQISGFFLMLNAKKSSPRFDFTLHPDDHASSVRTVAEATFVPSLHTWYHLAGVYDADGKTISLYVDGKLQRAIPCAKTWHAGGKTVIGRGFFDHKNVDFLTGMICDVRLYDSALTADQIQSLASR